MTRRIGYARVSSEDQDLSLQKASLDRDGCAIVFEEKRSGTLEVLFTARFIVQWLASEKVGKSVVPIAFWYFSICGGLIVLAYGIHKFDPVIILGQLPGTVIYARNLWLIRAETRA